MTTSALSSVDDLLARATSREPMKTADSLSGSSFERLVIDGERYVLKYVHCDDDWVARCLGDIGPRSVWVHRSDLLDAVSGRIDDLVVACDAGSGRNGWGGRLLLRDATGCLVPEGSFPIGLDQHRTFLDDMAYMHARFWDFTEPPASGLADLSHRYTALTPVTGAIETARGTADAVPNMLEQRWASFTGPDVVRRLVEHPWPLIDVLSSGPQTFTHNDWKFGNIGTLPDGRTLLIDWAWPARSPCTTDLAWYLAVNCDRLPESKEDAVEAYRTSLERHGVPTSGWWDAMYAAGMLGAFVQLGWSKDGPELDWWSQRAEEWAASLV